MIRCLSFARASVLALALAGTQANAGPSAEKHLPLDGNIAPNGSSVELRWPEADPPRAGAVQISRRRLGETGAQSWRPLGPALRPVMRFVDTDVQPGVAFEYRVMRLARDIVDVGYWATGVNLPAIEARGTVYLVVDRTVAEPLAPRLDRFTRDLIGDGWKLQRLDAPRGSSSNPQKNIEAAAGIRTWLQNHYIADPFSKHVVILVGHVPIPMSGQVSPDGHARQPHASDLFYGDMDGQWRVATDGMLLENSLPGDAIEMQVGRIDFAPLRDKDKDREIALLRSYLDRNHHWRMGLLGDIRQGYGQSDHLIAEQYGLRNIVGPEQVKSGKHYGVGARHPWLWGIDFGPADGSKRGQAFTNKAVFAINFGSHKQKIERSNNQLTTLLAQPWYTIAVGWGGRPAWWLHHMALGGTIGDVHMRTVNNGRGSVPYRETMDYFPTGKYLFRNPIWVNLLGDPTARAFILAPPARVTTEVRDGHVTVSWQASPDPDTLGYRLYRAEAGSMIFNPLDGGEVTTETTFADPEGTADARYMVRAQGLKDVHAGSFETLSQGVFSAPTSSPVQDFVLSTRKNTAIPLPAAFQAPGDGRIYAIIKGPETGAITWGETGWDYTPAEGFTGDIRLPFSVSDSWATQTGTLTITVTDG